MILGIVGHAQEKFTPDTEAKARAAIREEIALLRPTLIISGHSPMGGVDIYAEEIAAELQIPTRIFAPTVNQWGVRGGYRDRNWQSCHQLGSGASRGGKGIPARV